MGIERPTFATTRFRTGYAVQQVDVAVEMVLENFSLPRPRIDVDDLERLDFTMVIYQLGYDVEQVDDWIDTVTAELARRTGEAAEVGEAAEPEALTTSEAAPEPTTPAVRPDAIVEVPSSSSRWLLGLALLVVLAVVAFAFYA